MFVKPDLNCEMDVLPDFYKKLYINENYSNEYNILTEELGSFINQYQIADEIADVVMDMIKYEQMSKTIIKMFGNDKKKIHIEMVNYNYFNAQILDIWDDSFRLLINHSRFNKNVYSVNALKNNIKESIAHELMHAYIIYIRHDKNENINDIPNYHENLTRLYKDNKNTLFGKLCYVLYSTFYHERQAIVSQTSLSLKSLNPNNMPINRNRWRELIEECDPYIIFNFDLQVIREIKKLSIKEKSSIWRELTDNDIEFISFDKMLDNVEKKAMNGLKDVTRNAMLYFNELEEKHNKKK